MRPLSIAARFVGRALIAAPVFVFGLFANVAIGLAWLIATVATGAFRATRAVPRALLAVVRALPGGVRWLPRGLRLLPRFLLQTTLFGMEESKDVPALVFTSEALFSVLLGFLLLTVPAMALCGDEALWLTFALPALIVVRHWARHAMHLDDPAARGRWKHAFAIPLDYNEVDALRAAGFSALTEDDQ